MQTGPTQKIELLHKPTMKYRNLNIAAACALAVAARYAGQAQSTNTPTLLDKTVIEGIPLEETVVPTARPFNSVYGTDRSIIDTPRSVTIISREQMDAISIHDVREFSKLTSSSYTRSNFGAPTTPDIRTQYADTFVNGSRLGMSSNGNGLPVNFNSVESVNIVKGPAGVVYGPSQYVGGYVDMITKRPFFDGFHGEASAEVGMFDQYRWGLDFGAPISKTLAYRVSYSGEESGSYYYDGYKHTQAVYTALQWTPSDKYDLFLNGEFFRADYTENFGINRPTQALIDHGLYQTGVNANQPAGTPNSDPQNSQYVGSGYVPNHVALGPVVTIDRRLRLPTDGSDGFSANLQGIQTLHISDDTQVVNTSFGRYVRRETLSPYYYSEIIDPSWEIENRTELRLTKDSHAINTGIDLHYTAVRAFNDFYNEPANVWDLTKDRSYINIYNAAYFPSPFTSIPVPGWPGRYYTPDNGDSGESRTFDAALFYQHDWKITDRFSALFGGRGDLLSIDYRDPSHTLPGDSVSVLLPNVNTSLVYKWQPDLSSYFTYNWSENPVGSVGNGGGYTTAGNNNFSNANLRNEATLYEVGSKYSLLGNRLFLNLALYKQFRDDLQQDRSVVTFDTQGIEFEVNYQPDRNFYLTLGYSYTDARVNQEQFFVNNTDIPGYPSYSPAVGNFRRQGVPEHLLNFLANYKFDNGFGASANIVFTSPINNDVLGNIVIPAQYTLDLSVYYTHKRFEARLSALNVTDEKNWSAPNAVYGQESIIADLPFRLEGRVTLKF
jgi:catecholate siderophore receptor